NVAPTRAQTGSLADFEAALHNTRSRWHLGSLYRALDGLDPSQYRDAVNACLTATDSMARYAGLYAVGARWGQTDPQEALAFCQTLGNTLQRAQVIASVLGGWAEKDPSAAMSYAKQLPLGQTRNQAISAVAG